MASKVEELPTTVPTVRRNKSACVLRLNSFAIVFIGAVAFIVWTASNIPRSHRSHSLPPHATSALSRCKSLHEKPGPPRSFWSRTVSDRFEPGTPPTLIQNATIWTGGDDGYEIVLGDIFLDKGIIKAVGRVPPVLLDNAGSKLVTKNVGGAWVSPAINDMHSHLGVDSVPELRGMPFQFAHSLISHFPRFRRHQLAQSAYNALPPLSRRLQHSRCVFCTLS
ncbi:hypothetical protein FRC08_015500 [Ceratobasidium sp. 394]|nr:hypothetical protein FRC08_015500 [Ceratobasidium sp. 394]